MRLRVPIRSSTVLIVIQPSKGGQSMPIPESIHDYLRLFASELGERIVQSYPALQKGDDPLSPRLATLLRKPFPAQAVAAMGLSKKWETERSGDCGMRHRKKSHLARGNTRS